MSFAVVLLPSARGDLLRLASFLAEQAPAAVEPMRAALKDGLRSLAVMPNRGRAEGPNLRIAVPFGDGAYVVVYRVEVGRVVVLRVFHSREDWRRPEHQDT